MMITIDRNAAEASLICMLNTIGRSGIRCMSTLRAVPFLYEKFLESFRMWMTSVAFATNTCSSILRANGVSADEMTDDLLVRLMNPERRICRTSNRTLVESVNASLHPALDYVLDMAVETGARSVIMYLMRLAKNFCIEKFRKERDKVQKTVQIDPETLRHADENAVNEGGVKKHPHISACCEGEFVRRERMAAVFSCFDGDFLHDVSILGAALKIKRQALADVIFSGRCYTLACAMVREINNRLKDDYTECFVAFLQSARSYRLPAHLQADPKALLRRMYHNTNADSRQAMKRRILAATA